MRHIIAAATIIAVCSAAWADPLNSDPGLEDWAGGQLSEYQYFWSSDNRTLVTQETTDVYEGSSAVRLSGHVNDGTWQFNSYQHGAGFATPRTLTKTDFGGTGGTAMVSVRYKVVDLGDPLIPNTDWGGLAFSISEGGAADPWVGEGLFMASSPNLAPTELSTEWLTFSWEYTFLDTDPDGPFRVNIYHWGGYPQREAAFLVDDFQVNVPSTAVPGDTDGDGDVDLDDLFAVRNNFGVASGATRDMGDVAPHPDGDGMVDLDDLFMIRNNFGTGLAAVPEPLTLSLLAAGGLALLRRQR